MRVQVTRWSPYGSELIVAIVDPAWTVARTGHEILTRLSRHFPTNAIMLVSVESNGFRAYATFQTGVLLALLQLEELPFEEVDLLNPPHEENGLPF